VVLEVDPDDAEAAADDGVWLGERLVGFVTSGAYGHHVGASLALAYVDTDVAGDRPPLTVFVVGEPRPSRILPSAPYDPAGERLRG
jgi:dimethylglycine dehydrogenase